MATSLTESAASILIALWPIATSASPHSLPPTATAAQPPLLAPAVLDDQLEISGDIVAARSLHTRMSVAVKIGDRGPFRFLVDSGADRTVIGERLAEALALPRAATVNLQSIAGLSRVRTVRLINLVVGKSITAEIIAPVLREDDIGAQGILGLDALAEQRILLDFDRKEVTLQDTTHHIDPPVSDEIVVVARRRHGQLILTEARAAGTAISAVIDTGAQITIGNIVLYNRLTRSTRGKPLPPVTLTAVTGEQITAQSVYVREISIGKALLRDVTIVFVDLPTFRLFGLHDRPALLLGTDLLSNFRRVGLDFSRRRVRFQLRR
jgi:predicted aspartyl protease